MRSSIRIRANLEAFTVRPWTDYTEPARIRALVLAVVQLVGALGIVLPFDLPGFAEALIGVFAVVLPLITGELIRAKVTPVGRHAAREELSSRPEGEPR